MEYIAWIGEQMASANSYVSSTSCSAFTAITRIWASNDSNPSGCHADSTIDDSEHMTSHRCDSAESNMTVFAEHYSSLYGTRPAGNDMSGCLEKRASKDKEIVQMLNGVNSKLIEMRASVRDATSVLHELNSKFADLKQIAIDPEGNTMIERVKAMLTRVALLLAQATSTLECARCLLAEALAYSDARVSSSTCEATASRMAATEDYLDALAEHLDAAAKWRKAWLEHIETTLGAQGCTLVKGLLEPPLHQVAATGFWNRVTSCFDTAYKCIKTWGDQTCTSRAEPRSKIMNSGGASSSLTSTDRSISSAASSLNSVAGCNTLATYPSATYPSAAGYRRFSITAQTFPPYPSVSAMDERIAEFYRQRKIPVNVQVEMSKFYETHPEARAKLAGRLAVRDVAMAKAAERREREQTVVQLLWVLCECVHLQSSGSPDSRSAGL